MDPKYRRRPVAYLQEAINIVAIYTHNKCCFDLIKITLNIMDKRSQVKNHVHVLFVIRPVFTGLVDKKENN